MVLTSGCCIVVLSPCEYDMGIVDNLCSPGWEKDLTISVVSLDRKHEFKVAICPKSLASTYRIRRRFGYENFFVTRNCAEGDFDVACSVVRSSLHI